MPAHVDHYTNIFRYWRSVETFSLPDVNRKRGDAEPTILKPGVPLPWEDPAFPPPPENRRWKHTLYFHLVDKEAVVKLLATLTGSTEYRDPVAGETCMSALVLDQAGRPAVRSYAPVAFGYAIKLIRKKQNPELLTEELRQAQENYVTRFELEAHEEPVPVTWPLLQKELHHLQALTAAGLPIRTAVLCVSEATNPLATPDAPFLNSYFIRDLDTLIRHPREIGESLQRLLAPQPQAPRQPETPPLQPQTPQRPQDPLQPQTPQQPQDPQQSQDPQQPQDPQPKPQARQDLLDPRNLLLHLDPRNLSPGRWPASPVHGLYSAQMAALNITLSTLRPDGQPPKHTASPHMPPGAAVASAPLLGINGPPGTGKTTLLREVIADIIVNRATRLLRADPDTLFATQRISISERAGYYPIDEIVFGNDGIVVAGSNNTAIENISRELPQLRSVDRAAFPDVDYFSAIASGIFGEPAWGLVSAVLGRSDNRTAFIEKFWFQKGRNFNRYLREQAEQVDEARAHFAETAAELTSLLQEFERFRTVASAYHDVLLAGAKPSASPDTAEALNDPHSNAAEPAILAHRLLAEYEIPAANLPGPGFTNLPVAAIHRLTPYSSEKLNTLRSTIFLRSLELHEWAIRANAAGFQANLRAFVDMLAGRYREQIDEPVASILWSSFFFCIPVVSVTLASFHRQFGRLGQGALGWLLLDEAGQATLPSIAGALWRARRSILIGDTRQIAPVVSIPQALDKLLQKNYTTSDDWSPLHHSAQSLADRITPIGTWLDNPANSATATGAPHLANSASPASGPPSSHIWTGLPLRAHRRCDEPMFTIANTIAYNGQMVRVDQPPPGTATHSASIGVLPTSHAATVSALPASTWLDIRGITAIEGHALYEELDATRTLLQQLVAHEGKIFIISPFRSVAMSCKEQFQRRGRIECGTIHTFQGREADMVILVLGTLQHSKKARDWVAASPNILNVAITRARHRIYVIGNYKTWSAHRYFDYLSQVLPIRPPAA
ncbi:MAG TPA: AAA domain-containing protein [Puia sp.]|nr:AAA domain-containing protein [Puia sp.]